MLISDILNSINEEEEIDHLLLRLLKARQSLLDFIISSTGLCISNTFISGVAIYDKSFEELFWMMGGGLTLTKNGIPKENVSYSLDFSPFKIDNKFVYFKLEFSTYNMEILVSENNKIFYRERQDMFTDNKIDKLSLISKDKFLKMNLKN